MLFKPKGSRTHIKRITEEERYHIFSWVFMICLCGLVLVRLIAYIKLEYLSQIMQFLFFIVAIWSFFEAINYYQKIQNTTK